MRAPGRARTCAAGSGRAGVLAVALAACGAGAAPRSSPAGPAASPPADPAAPPAAPAWTLRPLRAFRGACDASGVERLASGRVAVADDEHNVLSVYDPGGGAALERVDLAPFLELGDDADEADLEAMARLGDRIVVVASHGRKKSGKPAPARLRLAAVREVQGRAALHLEAVGHAYGGLVADLVAAPALASYQLARAAARSPKVAGGLNVEGAAAGAGDRLWIGLRSPLIDGRALLVELGAPERMFAGAPARLERHVLLDLGGRGVRSLADVDGGLVIAAGPPVAEPLATRLYRWTPGEPDARPLAVDLGDLNVEAVVALGDGALLLLSDDGERLVDGVPCKKHPDPARRSFRGARLERQ